MATSPLPLNEKPFYSTDSIANSLAADDMMDCYLEPVPGVGFVTRRRPGLKLFCDLGTGAPGDGLFYWDAKGKVVAVSGGKIFDIGSTGTFVDITGAALNAGIPVTFAPGQDTGGAPWLYLANGKLVYTTGASTVSPEAIQVRTITANRTAFASTTGGSWALSVGAYTDATYATRVTFKNNSTVDLSAITMTITGTDIYGAALVEVLALPPGGGLVTSAGWFKTVVSIVPSAAVSTAAPTAISVSVTGLTWVADNPVPSDGGAHKVTIRNNTATDHSGKTVTITGLSATGLSINDIFSLPAASLSVTSATSFAKIVSVVPSATISADTMSLGWIGQTVDVGWSADAQQLGSDNTPASTHVAFIKGSFLGNEPNSNRFDFTDTNPNTGLLDNAYWNSTDNPLTCDAEGDQLSALFVAWQEIYAWGTSGLEIWQNDGVTPFSPIAGAFSEGGIEAPYSIVTADNTVFALCVVAGARVVVKLAGRAPVVISDAIARILAEMPTVSDAIGDLICVGGLTIYLLSFPTAGQTWAYDYKNDTWVRWGYWQAGEHQQFLGLHSTFVKPWNKHLVMSRLDGKIYEMDRGTFDDAGTEMVSYRRTGWINHGTYNRKICDQFYTKCKAGMSDIGTLLVRWRDDGREEWSNYLELALNPVGVRDFLSKNNRFGMYRSRQYEFRLSDNCDLVLVGVDAEMRVLSS